jgi:ribosome biogenesis GTPase A
VGKSSLMNAIMGKKVRRNKLLQVNVWNILEGASSSDSDADH